MSACSFTFINRSLYVGNTVCVRINMRPKLETKTVSCCCAATVLQLIDTMSVKVNKSVCFINSGIKIYDLLGVILKYAGKNRQKAAIKINNSGFSSTNL